MVKTGSWLVTFLILMFPILTLADKPTQVIGSVDRNEMSLGDTFTFTVEVSSGSSVNVEDPRLPSLDGFELLNQWSGVESRSTFANGSFEVTQTRSFNYMLAAQQAGEFTLGAATVIVEGKPFTTQPIRIKVQQGGGVAPQARGRGQPQQVPQDPFEEADDIFNQLLQRRMGQLGGGGTRTQPVNPDDSFFIQVDVDKKKAYVGEQITGTWWIYTRGQVHDIDTLKYPSLSGFWKEEIELATRLSFQQEVVNGIVWQKALLASYALFPIKPGKVEIDPYKAKCTVSVPSNFGFGRPYQATKASQAMNIDVIPVPTEGRPANYTGAVGQFTARSEVAQTTVVAHQPMVLKFKIEGRGNAKLIDLPPLNLPAGVEIYDTKFNAKFFREGNSYKEFEITLIPRQAGAVVLPAIATSAFDPQTQKFYEFSSQPINLTVLPGTAPTAAAPLVAEKPNIDDKSKLPDLMLTIDASQSFSPWAKGLLWTFIYGLALAILAWRLLTEGDFIQRRRDILKIVETRLKKVRNYADSGQWRKVGVEGTNLVYYVLGEISNLGGAAVEMEKLILKVPPSVRRELTDSFKKVLSELELLSFAPENLVGARKEKAALRTLVSQLDELLIKAVKLSAQTLEPETQGASV